MIPYTAPSAIWGIYFKKEWRFVNWRIKRMLITDASQYPEDLQYLSNQYLIPISKEEWEKGNQGYI
jgi:hypothetical protein